MPRTSPSSSRTPSAVCGGGAGGRGGLCEPHRARQLVRARDHGGQLVERGERGDPPAAALVEHAHEAALVLADGRGLEPLAAKRDRGAPRAFDADFGVTGAGFFYGFGETIFQRMSFSLSR